MRATKRILVRLFFALTAVAGLAESIYADELSANRGWGSFGAVAGGGRYSALEQANLPAPGMAVPMTYEAGPDSRQFVVIAAGGNALAGTKLNDTLVAFSLPSPR